MGRFWIASFAGLCLFYCQVAEEACSPLDLSCNPVAGSLFFKRPDRLPTGTLFASTPATSAISIYSLNILSGMPGSASYNPGFSNVNIVRSSGNIFVIQDNSNLTMASVAGGSVSTIPFSESSGLQWGTLENVNSRLLYYVHNNTTNFLNIYLVSASGIQKIQAFSTGLSSLNFLALHPSHRYIYDTQTTAIELFKYDMDPATGLITGNPVNLGIGGVTPDAIAVEPEGRFLFMQDSGGSGVHTYNIDQGDGSLSNPSLSLAGVANQGTRFHFSTSGRQLYAFSGQGLFACRINSDGSLTQLQALAPRGNSAVPNYKAYSGMTFDFSKNFYYLASDSPAGLYLGRVEADESLSLDTFIPVATPPALVATLYN